MLTMDDQSLPAAADALALLGDETRLAIVLALHDHEHRDSGGLEFEALRHAVGVTDSGRFNYHLDKLRGRYCYRDDGAYRLRFAGRTIADLIKSGALVEDVPEVGGQTAIACPTCEVLMDAHYEGGRFELGCPVEDEIFLSLPLPPGAVRSRSIEELTDLASLTSLHYVELAREGACPFCWGQITTAFSDADESVVVGHDCDTCGVTISERASLVPLSHPTVTAFHADEGIDVDGTFFEKLRVLDTSSAWVTGETVTVRYEGASENLVVELDGTDVVSVDRQPRE